VDHGVRTGWPVVLGTSERGASGFQPERGIRAPSAGFEIQQHEVTWRELTGWLAAHPQAGFAPAAGGPVRPAVGVPWSVANAYCASLPGALPSEEQWEYAARGPLLRPNPWGPTPLAPKQILAYGGKHAQPADVMTSRQDVTPGDAGSPSTTWPANGAGVDRGRVARQ